MSETGITIRNVGRHIQGTEVLHPVTLSIPSGAVTALIGPNGAGKSTLVRMIARVDPLETGDITVNGLDLRHTPTARLALEMAFMGQHSGLASRLRVRELVAFGRWPHSHGRPNPADMAAVMQAMTDFDLLPYADRFMDELSGGQAQRAHLAMTVAQDTPWVLLDEPLNNLDLAHARALMAHLARLRDAGRSVLVVLHDLNFASGWADHVVAMKSGAVVATGGVDDVLTEPVLSDLYDTPVAVSRYRDRPLILHHV